MKLNGKAKEDFEKWMIKNNPFLYGGEEPIIKIDDLHGYYIYGYIVEWFDSLQIYILIERGISEFYFKIKIQSGINKTFIQEDDSKDRNYCILKAIEKAVDLYNQQNNL